MKPPAIFAFTWRTGCEALPPEDFFTLTAAIPGHPQGSTVSRRTLVRLGYAVPVTLISPAAMAGGRRCLPELNLVQRSGVASDAVSPNNNRLRVRLVGFVCSIAGALSFFGWQVRSFTVGVHPRNQRGHRLARWLAVSPQLRRYA